MIEIKKIKKKDVCKKWVNYLNDPIVTRFSIHSKRKHTLKSQNQFVKEKLQDGNCIIFKILFKKKFIGTAEIKNIDNINKYAEVSYMIGDKSMWGRGIGTIVVKKIIMFAKKKLKINKIGAMIMHNNIYSEKVLKNNNFKQFGVIKEFYIKNNKKINKVFFIKHLT